MASYKDWISKIDIDIDYFAAFIKAWIAFNSWYRSQFPDGSDRDVVEKIKSENNAFRSYLEAFLDKHSESDNSVYFRENLDKLHKALLEAAISTQERTGDSRQITFTEIPCVNTKNKIDECKRNIRFKIERSRQKVTMSVFHNERPSEIYFEFEQESYNEIEIDRHSDFLSMADSNQKRFKAFYKEVRPYIIENILTRNSRTNEVVFIDDRTKVSQGIIEVLYLLRCSLMHGDVFPDKVTSEVYKFAYNILAMTLKKLV